MIKSSVKRHIAHLGAIIFNYSMVGFAITLALAIGIVAYPFLAILAMFALVVYYFILVIGAIFTVGVVLITPEYRALFSGPIPKFLMNIGESTMPVVDKMLDLIPIIGIITIVLIAISMVLLIIDWKREKSIGRVVALFIILIITITIILLALLGVLAILGGVMVNEGR